MFRQNSLSRIAWLALAAAGAAAGTGAGCSKNNKPTPAKAERPATDELWAMAPPETALGIVVAPGTLAMLDRAVVELRSSLPGRPGGQELVDDIMGELTRNLPPMVLDPAERARMGVDSTRGAALFVLPGGPREGQATLILPVAADSEAARMLQGKMACHTVRGYFACAPKSKEELLAGVGQSDAMAQRMAKTPAELRGHVEVLADLKALGGNDIDAPWRHVLAGDEVLHAAALLERGGFTVRAHLRGTPKGPLESFPKVPSTLASEAAASGAAGMMRVRVPLASLVPMDQLAGGLAPLLGGAIDVRAALLDNLTGELVVAAWPSGRAELALGMRDVAKLAPLVTLACTMAQAQALPVDIRSEADRCIATLDAAELGPAAASLPIAGPMTASLGTRTGALVMELILASDKSAPAKAQATDAGAELMGGAWSAAMWGHGIALGNPEAFASMQSKLDSPELPENIKHGLWALLYLRELGLGAAVREDGLHGLLRVGTQWANPDEVLRQFQEQVNRVVANEDGAVDGMQALARKHAGTPLERSYQAGLGGLLPATAGAGMVAAIAIPAYLKYIQKLKTMEATQLVKHLHDSARAYSMDPPLNADGSRGSRLPMPSAGPTPPLGTCCQQGGKCAPDAAQWQTSPWTELQFAVQDPHYYSYQYEVIDENREFVVRAFGDLDCDGVYSTFEMSAVIGDDGMSSSPQLLRVNETE